MRVPGREKFIMTGLDYYVVRGAAKGAPGICGAPYLATAEIDHPLLGLHMSGKGDESNVVPIWRTDNVLAAQLQAFHPDVEAKISY